MSRVYPKAIVVERIDQVEDFCFDKCIKKITGRPMRFQEVCMENCFKKTLSGLDFLARVESLGGVDRG